MITILFNFNKYLFIRQYEYQVSKSCKLDLIILYRVNMTIIGAKIYNILRKYNISASRKFITYYISIIYQKYVYDIRATYIFLLQ